MMCGEDKLWIKKKRLNIEFTMNGHNNFLGSL